VLIQYEAYNFVIRKQIYSGFSQTQQYKFLFLMQNTSMISFGRGVCRQSRWRHSVTVLHTRWRICVTMATLWQQQDGGYMLLWKRYGDNKMAVMSYYGSVFYIFNSTVIDWTLIFLLPWQHVVVNWLSSGHLYKTWNKARVVHIAFM